MDYEESHSEDDDDVCERWGADDVEFGGDIGGGDDGDDDNNGWWWWWRWDDDENGYDNDHDHDNECVTVILCGN